MQITIIFFSLFIMEQPCKSYLRAYRGNCTNFPHMACVDPPALPINSYVFCFFGCNNLPL